MYMSNVRTSTGVTSILRLVPPWSPPVPPPAARLASTLPGSAGPPGCMPLTAAAAATALSRAEHFANLND
jgi:hypothetical protein